MNDAAPLADVEDTTLHFAYLLQPSFKENANRLGDIWIRTLKRRTAAKLVLKLHELGVARDKASQMEFSPELTTFLREKKVVKTVKVCLERIHRICNIRNKVARVPNEEPPARVNVRIFLAAYMIVAHPDRIFESLVEPLVQPLRDAAATLLDQFESICGAILDHPCKAYNDLPLDLTAGFGDNLSAYFAAFAAWKVPDEVRLITRIKHALVALYQAHAVLPADEPANSPLRREFGTQVARLLNKLHQVGGVNEVTTFAATTPMPLGILMADIDAGAVTTLAPANHDGTVAPTPVDLSGRMNNEQLAHALLIDPAFTLDDNGLVNARFTQIRNMFQRAFYESLIDDISLRPHPSFTRVARIIGEVRISLCEIGGVWPQEIDVAQLQERGEQRALTWDDICAGVRSILAAIQRTQTQRRVDETAARWAVVRQSLEAAADSEADQPRAFCGALEFFMDRVSALRIDSANSRLRTIAPVIAAHGYAYEAGKFADKVAAGTITLERTLAWIYHAIFQSPTLGFVDGPLPNMAQYCAGVQARAALGLVFQVEPITQDNVPETLALDRPCLASLQKEAHYITSSATLLIMAARVLGEDNTQPFATPESIQTNAIIHAQIAETLADADLLNDEGARQVTHSRLTSTPLSTEIRDKLQRALSLCDNRGDPVYTLMALRVQRLWEQTFTAGVAQTSVDGIPPPAASVVPRITKAALLHARIAEVNRGVHLPRYQEMIQELLRGATAPGTGG